MQTQLAIEAITEELLRELGPQSAFTDCLLVPILRSGLSMWHTATVYFSHPETVFVGCTKRKGTSSVRVVPVGLQKIKPTERSVVLLDPIVATGDTVLSVLDFVGHQVEPSERVTVDLLCCYAAPLAIERLVREGDLRRIIVGGLADGVDTSGFLYPPTHGDMGDKLFGTT